MSEEREREALAYLAELAAQVGTVNPYDATRTPLGLDGVVALLRVRFPEIPADFRLNVTLH